MAALKSHLKPLIDISLSEEYKKIGGRDCFRKISKLSLQFSASDFCRVEIKRKKTLLISWAYVTRNLFKKIWNSQSFSYLIILFTIKRISQSIWKSHSIHVSVSRVRCLLLLSVLQRMPVEYGFFYYRQQCNWIKRTDTEHWALLFHPYCFSFQKI